MSWIDDVKAQYFTNKLATKEETLEKTHESFKDQKNEDVELVNLFHEAVDPTMIEIEKVIGKIGCSEAHFENGAGSWIPRSESFDKGQQEIFKYYAVQWIIRDGKNLIFLHLGADFIEKNTIVVPVIRATYNNPCNYSGGFDALIIKTNSLVITAEEIELKFKAWLHKTWSICELSGRK